MSLNTENLFVKSDDQAKIGEILRVYWQNVSQNSQPDWGLPSSFKPILEQEAKRKVAISSPKNGWIMVIESKEVVDFALAKLLSEKLNTTVLIIQLYEITGSAGYAAATRGQILESFFSEDHDMPLTLIQTMLRKYDVPFDATPFPEVFNSSSLGWIVSQQTSNSIRA